MEPGPDGDQEYGHFNAKLFFSIVGGKCKYERMRLLSGPQCCFFGFFTLHISSLKIEDEFFSEMLVFACETGYKPCQDPEDNTRCQKLETWAVLRSVLTYVSVFLSLQNRMM